MNLNFHNNKGFIYIIPLVYILWSMFLLHLYGPFYLNRIDPEFPYLLNGLACARIDFSRIGLVEHPGTPFHIFTGVFIQIIYLIFGQGTIVEDVISRPEIYLTGSSFILTLITSLILLWYGKLVLKYKLNIIVAVFLQSTVLINTLLIDLPRRFIPDRMLFIYVLIFIGLCIKYLYQKDYNAKKFAIYSGLLMGIGFVTKFHFLPILIIPFIVVGSFKNKLIYLGSFIVSVFISFLPIIDKFSQFKSFIVGIFTHDGLYGGGTEQIINMQSYWMNIANIFLQNISFTIIFIIALVLLGILVFNKKIFQAHKKESVFLFALILVIVIGVLMISKHYKNYYVIPIVTLSGFVLMLVWKFINQLYKGKYLNIIFYILIAILIVQPVLKLYPAYKNIKYANMQNQLISNYIKNHIPSTDYFFIEPTWMAGPIMENGLVYGVSYVAFRHYYYNEFERFYPNVITWEGDNKPIKYFRMLDADNEAILKSGKNIYILSTTGRHANMLCNYIDSCFQQIHVGYLQDTVFQNNSTNEYVIRYQNYDSWKTKVDVRFGFEKVNGDLWYSDDEKFTMQGSFERSEKRPANGMFTLKVLPDQQSPEFMFNDVSKGDFLEITIKRRRNNNEIKGNLHLFYSIPDSSNTEVATGKYISHISSYYELLRLTAEVPELPENAILKCCYFNPGNNEEFVDDMTLKHFSKH